MLKTAIAIFFILFACFDASSRQVTIATWNLGWHMDIATAQRWIDACNKTYLQAEDNKSWKPSTDPSAITGWDVPDTFSIIGWDVANLPVCDVYYYKGVLRVKLEAYRQRQIQIAQFISRSVPADVVAFQEVSGEQAVREVLPGGGADYDVCSFDGYKVQRLAIAWKRTLGAEVSCSTEAALSLPQNPAKDRPRPGLSLTLDLGGAKFRVLNVHLKSSCVSPLDNGRLEGESRDCKILQQQIDPLESWLERETSDGVKTVLLGDFNRNLWHELRDQRSVRTDGSPPSSPRPAGIRSRFLLKEISDGLPAESLMALVAESCRTNKAGMLLCKESEKRKLNAEEISLLRSPLYLGCWNPVGLDHILVGSGVNPVEPAAHVSIGRLGATRQKDDGTDQYLAISDHCPLLAKLDL